jgi:phosphate uptake regulator
VKAAARPLVGLEIVEESVHKIVLQCLLEPSAFPPDKILRREHLLAAGMHRDVITAFVEADSNLAKAVIERDEEVNRLYFLLVRLLRTMILNPRLSEKMGLHPIDCLDYRLVAGFVESIGDHAAEIARNIIRFSETPIPKSTLHAVSRLSDLSYEMHKSAMRAIFSRDVDLAEGIQNKRVSIKELVQELDVLLAGQPNMVPYISAVVSSLSRICDYSVDVADLVMPR